MLRQMTHGTPAELHFLSILQHMLLIRDDYWARPQYFKLLDQCVSQIVLHKNGIDPDFHYTKKFDVEVDPLIEGLVDKARVEEAEFRADDLERILQREEAARNEMEAKLHTVTEQMEENQKSFETQLQDKENEIRQLKEELVRRPTVAAGGGGGGAPAAPAGGPPPPPPPPPPGPGGGPPAPPPPPGPPPVPGAPPPPPGAPAAPPPPGGGFRLQGPPGLKEKRSYKLDVQMRRMNWNKVQRAQIKEGSFWAVANDETFASAEFFQELEKTFATGRARNLEMEQASTKFKAPKVRQLKVIDAKSAQNISILLGTLRMRHTDVRKLVLSVDDDKLTEQLLQQLLKYLPNKEEMMQLSSYRDKLSELNDAEQFGVVMSDVKRLPERLECMVFRVRFAEEVAELQPSISAVTTACREIRTSRKFAKLLELILMMGNYMNAGSRNQQSHGFELSYLTKLASTKSADQKTTLLHFVANIAETRHPDIADFTSELRNVEEASRSSEETMSKAIKQMEAGLQKIKTELKQHSKPQDRSDKFAEKLKEFASTAETRFSKLREQYTLMEKKFDDLANYYSMDRKKFSMEEFFGDLTMFCKDFERAKKENAKIREQLERQRLLKEREERAKQAKKRPTAKANPKVIDLSKGGDEEGVLDNLLECLQSGSALQPAKAKRRGGAKFPFQAQRSRPGIQPSTETSESGLPNHIGGGGGAQATDRPPKPYSQYSSSSRSREHGGPSQAEEILARMRDRQPLSSGTML